MFNCNRTNHQLDEFEMNSPEASLSQDFESILEEKSLDEFEELDIETLSSEREEELRKEEEEQAKETEEKERRKALLQSLLSIPTV